MKRNLGIIALIIMVVFLSGCGKQTSKYLLDIDYSDYVTVCDYNNVKATKVTFEVSETDVRQQINQDMYAYVTYEPVTDRGAKEGDFVNIDYTGVIDGVELAEYTDTARDFLLGEGYLYKEADEALIGMKPDEEKTVSIVLDKTTAKNESEVGKTLVLTIKLNEISVENLPDYNDAFVQTNLGFNSVEAYEASVRAKLEYTKKEQYKNVAVEEIMTYLRENSVFDTYPQELYDECKENFETINTQYAQQFNMDLDAYLNLYGIDEDQKEQMIISNVNTALIVGAIAQKEEIDCTDDVVEAYYQANYEQYGYDNAADFKVDYKERQIGYEIIYEKVADLLYNSASLTSMTEEEYLNQQEADETDSIDPDSIATDESELVDEPMVIDDTETISDTEEAETSEDTTQVPDDAGTP